MDTLACDECFLCSCMTEGFILFDERNTPDDEFVWSTTKLRPESIDDDKYEGWFIGMPGAHYYCLVTLHYEYRHRSAPDV